MAKLYPTFWYCSPKYEGSPKEEDSPKNKDYPKIKDTLKKEHATQKGR